ncbi:hypothetical protein ACFXTU_001868 [Salmonella enterica]
MRNDETQVIPADIFSGVTVLRLNNGDEAVYIHGLFLECADIAQGDRPLADYCCTPRRASEDTVQTDNATCPGG